MSQSDLTSYLNDHLAGSVGAIEMVERLASVFEGKPLGKFFEHLRHEIEQDQTTLKNLIHALGQQESSVKNAGAWVGEKFSRIKILLTDSSEDQLGLLHALEGLALGITGKRQLWCALEAVAETNLRLRGLDYPRLKQRAEEQRDLVEEKRLAVARQIFSSA